MVVNADSGNVFTLRILNILCAKQFRSAVYIHVILEQGRKRFRVRIIAALKPALG